jgi:predicted CopG family antitoxin
MATKTITIKEEAYDRLKALKDGKSFSDLIIDLTDNREVDLSESHGEWSKKEAEEAERKISEFRKDFEESFDEKLQS